MPNCPTCGSLVNETDRFCSRCGQLLSIQAAAFQNGAKASFPDKPSLNFANGGYIGGGIVLLAVGLLMALALNGIYWAQINYLVGHGIQVNEFSFGSRDIISLISLGALLAMMGAYLISLGSLNQFNAKVRSAMSIKDNTARLGTGLISGGFVFTALTATSLIEQSYHPYRSSGFDAIQSLLTIGGLVIICVGALLIRSSYLKANAPTKV